MKKLIVMSGIPGCGKSTYIKQNYPNALVINMDTIRLELLGNEEDFSRDKMCWEVFKKRLKNNDSEIVIADGTNCTNNRLRTYTKYRKIYDVIEVVEIQCPLCLAIKQNNKRDRHVPADVIVEYFRQQQKRDLSKIQDLFDSIQIIKKTF